MVLAFALLLAGCGAVATPLPDATHTVPTDLLAEATPEPTATWLAALPTSANTTRAKEAEPRSPTSTQVPIETDLPGAVQINIVYDNTAVAPGLGAEWGFAAWIEVGHRQILFDTGPDGPTLLSNLVQLGLDPEDLDAVILSHEHADHIGGLESLLDTGIQPPAYAPRAFSELSLARVRARTELIEVLDPVEIVPGVHSTGQMGDGPAEQALVIQSPEGLVVVTGCAHPGILRIVRQAQTLVEDDVALVLGGFHLVDTQAETVNDIVATFRDLGVKRVAPTHCTGEAAMRTFATEYGPDCLAGGAGQVFVIGLGEEP